MSVSPTNPFVLPGLGQSGEQAANPLLASMEMMRQAFAGMAGTGGFSSGMPMTPSMNPEDLEKRISELKTVENWLKLNLSMLSSTIQGMEVQLATIATLRSFASSMSQAQQNTGVDAPTALEVMLGLRPQTRTSQAETKQEKSTEKPPEKPQQPEQEPEANAAVNPDASQAAGVAQDASGNVPAAAKAWWDMLQKQFGQVAAATAATLKQSAEKSVPKSPATQTTTAARAVKKTTTSSARKKPTPKK